MIENTPLIQSAEYLEGYKIAVTFADGKHGVLDLSERLWGEVFEPLKDVGYFRPNCRKGAVVTGS